MASLLNFKLLVAREGKSEVCTCTGARMGSRAPCCKSEEHPTQRHSCAADAMPRASCLRHPLASCRARTSSQQLAASQAACVLPLQHATSNPEQPQLTES